MEGQKRPPTPLKILEEGVTREECVKERRDGGGMGGMVGEGGGRGMGIGVGGGLGDRRMFRLSIAKESIPEKDVFFSLSLSFLLSLSLHLAMCCFLIPFSISCF